MPPSLPPFARSGGFRSVVLVSGHLTDLPDRVGVRFPESEAERVGAAITSQFADWDIGAKDVVICGGARGADLLAAGVARACGAVVWIFLAGAAEEFETTSVAGADPVWVERYWDVLQHVPSWTLAESGHYAGREDNFAAVNEWMIETAQRQAPADMIHVLAVWDGRGAGGVGGTAEVVAAARALGWTVAVIDPRPVEKDRHRTK